MYRRKSNYSFSDAAVNREEYHEVACVDKNIINDYSYVFGQCIKNVDIREVKELDKIISESKTECKDEYRNHKTRSNDREFNVQMKVVSCLCPEEMFFLVKRTTSTDNEVCIVYFVL